MLPDESLDVSLSLREGVGERVRVRSRADVGPRLRPLLCSAAGPAVLCARGRERGRGDAEERGEEREGVRERGGDEREERRGEGGGEEGEEAGEDAVEGCCEEHF